MSLSYATSTRGGSHHDSRPTAEYGKLDRRTVEGKAKHVYNCQHMCTVGDSMVICRFAEKSLGLILTDQYVELVNLVTGFNLDLAELNTIGERIYNLERAFNVRAGFRGKDDDLPDRIKNEPIPDGPSKGMKAEPDFTNMKKELYELRGWDSQTGIPTKEKLIELGLDDVAKDLEGLK
jgi:aldehyde:ferredoxin oxidoreductase